MSEKRWTVRAGERLADLERRAKGKALCPFVPRACACMHALVSFWTVDVNFPFQFWAWAFEMIWNVLPIGKYGFERLSVVSFQFLVGAIWQCACGILI